MQSRSEHAELACLAHTHLARGLHRRLVAAAATAAATTAPAATAAAHATKNDTVTTTTPTNALAQAAQQVITLYVRAAELCPHRAEPRFELARVYATLPDAALPATLASRVARQGQRTSAAAASVVKLRAALKEAVTAAQTPFPIEDSLVRP